MEDEDREVFDNLSFVQVRFLSLNRPIDLVRAQGARGGAGAGAAAGSARYRDLAGDPARLG
jgi:hypothetical protein